MQRIPAISIRIALFVVVVPRAMTLSTTLEARVRMNAALEHEQRKVVYNGNTFSNCSVTVVSKIIARTKKS